MNDERRRALREQYRQRAVVGGVYRIRNTENGRFLMEADENMDGAENGFRFAVMTTGFSRPDLRNMTEDWKQYGKDAFVFERLELLEKEEAQTMQEFREELDVLLELWTEKTDMQLSYK